MLPTALNTELVAPQTRAKHMGLSTGYTRLLSHLYKQLERFMEVGTVGGPGTNSPWMLREAFI